MSAGGEGERFYFEHVLMKFLGKMKQSKESRDTGSVDRGMSLSQHPGCILLWLLSNIACSSGPRGSNESLG